MRLTPSCLANVDSATKNTLRPAHTGNTCELRMQIWILSWRPQYDIHHPRLPINNDTETDLLHQEGHEWRDSDSEFDPDSAGCEHDAFNHDIANASDTVIPKGTPGSLADNETHYEGSGEAVGDVNRFKQECDNLSQDPWAPFTSAHGFKLASWLIQNKVS